MIGEPTNFVHTAHVGSGDLFSGMNSVSVLVEDIDGVLGHRPNVTCMTGACILNGYTMLSECVDTEYKYISI